MKAIAFHVIKGVSAALIMATFLWWLPIFMQLIIPYFLLAVLTLLFVMLGGYVAARRSLRPILTGMITGLVSMLIISSFSAPTEELWLIPVMIILGSASATLGAYIALWAGHTGAMK